MDKLIPEHVTLAGVSHVWFASHYLNSEIGLLFVDRTWRRKRLRLYKHWIDCKW